MKETAGGVLEAVKDNLNRLTNLAATNTATSAAITTFGYSYDAAGNRTQKATLDFTEDYKYDALSRLTRSDRTNPGATPPNQWTWGYDAVGNRLSAQKDSEATTSSYNEKNQLLGSTGGGKMLWRGTLDEPGIATFSAPTINGQPARMLAGNVFEAMLDLPAGANTVTIQAQDGSGNIATKAYSVNVLGVPSSYTYDANGNLSGKTEGADSWTYTWNAENQLTTVTKNATTVATYAYDAVGRRVERNAGGTITASIYDDQDILSQRATTAGTTVTTRFVHGPETDEQLAQEEAGVLTYLQGDALGSITRNTTPLGVVSSSVSFDAWGRVETGSPGTYGFTGREWDAVPSLAYFRARYLDPSSGRFLSQDPQKSMRGDTQYGYVDGNPVRFIDPSGRAGEDHRTGPWRDCGGGCRLRIDTAGGRRHLHWECGRGSQSGEMGEFGGESHGGTWEDAPRKIRDCARRWKFEPEPQSEMSCNAVCKVTPPLIILAYLGYKAAEFFVCPPLVLIP